MQEIELKFQIPAAQVIGVRQAIEAAAHQATGAPQAPLPLHAAYFDTPTNTLARHKMALRVRREGDDWVQTFKAAGADAMTRVEDNQPRHVPDHCMPAPDLSLHTPSAQSALQAALPWQPAQDPHGQSLGLIALYETRFERKHALLTEPQGQVIVCIDEGAITAGALHAPLAELELELTQGHPLAVIAVARRWVAEHGIWLDVHSKAYRGTRLAQAAASAQPLQPQQPPAARPVPSPVACPDEPRQALSQALDAAAGNWSEVATGYPGWSAALLAWHDTLRWLLDLLDQPQGPGTSGPKLTAAMPALFWQSTQQQCSALQTLIGHEQPPALRAREADTGWRDQAQALATNAHTTLWALDILQSLKRAA